MSNEEKLEKLNTWIEPDSLSKSHSQLLLDSAGDVILNRLYPAKRPDDAAVPARYEMLQIQIAAEIYSKQGAEGESSHSENGISRVYESAGVSPSLLNQIVPYVGVIG